MLQNPPSFGIDILLKEEECLNSLSKRRVGLITNQNALTQEYFPSAQALQKKLGSALKCIFAPEHGWSGLIAEGKDIRDGFDPYLQLPVLSLYGKNKTFLNFIIANNIDVVLVDLQDVGVRCFTYISTCAKFLEACAGRDMEIIVCDRPNPLGPEQQGPLLNPLYRSLVGYLDVPFQHGQTLGQLLSTFNQTLGSKQLPLTVMPCSSFHDPFAYPWVPPSPNLPSWESVLLYPGLVLLEGTNISEGRGTTLPFTCLGAPDLRHHELVEFLNSLELGVRARPITFTPQSGKFVGQECQGAHLLIANKKVEALSLGIALLHTLKEKTSAFEWVKEERKGTYFIDYLFGTATFREAVDQGLSLSQLFARFLTPSQGPCSLLC